MPPPIGGLGVSKAPQGDKPVFASTRFNESSQLCSAPDGQAERTDTTVTSASGVFIRQKPKRDPAKTYLTEWPPGAQIDSLKIKSLYTPGHTSDSYSFLLDNHLFTGDTLLINGTGRTDFQNGSSEDAYNSLFNNLLKLPDETLVYPGHDYNGKFSSTIGNEKKFNPRLQVKSVNEYVDIMSKLNLARPKMIESNVSRNIQLGAN